MKFWSLFFTKYLPSHNEMEAKDIYKFLKILNFGEGFARDSVPRMWL